MPPGLPDECPRVTGRISAAVADREVDRVLAAGGRRVEAVRQRPLHRETVARNPLAVDAERPGRNPRKVVRDAEPQRLRFRKGRPGGEERPDRRCQRVGHDDQIARRAGDGRDGTVRVASSDVIESALAAATGQYGAELQLPGHLRADCHERRSPQRGCRLEEPVGRGEHDDARSALRRVETFGMQEERFVERSLLDADFGSIDFLIWLDIKNIPERYLRHFMNGIEI